VFFGFLQAFFLRLGFYSPPRFDIPLSLLVWWIPHLYVKNSKPIRGPKPSFLFFANPPAHSNSPASPPLTFLSPYNWAKNFFSALSGTPQALYSHAGFILTQTPSLKSNELLRPPFLCPVFCLHEILVRRNSFPTLVAFPFFLFPFFLLQIGPKKGVPPLIWRYDARLNCNFPASFL